jgi:hypothetical protein
MLTMFSAMIVAVSVQIVFASFSPAISGWYLVGICLISCHIFTCLAVFQMPFLARHIKDEIDFSRGRPSFLKFSFYLFTWCLVIGCQMVVLSFYWIGYGRWAQRK